MMKTLIIASVYIIAWILFATYGSTNRDTVVVYELILRDEPKAGYPEWIDLRPTLYRISGQNVVEQIEGFVPKRYNDCAVIDIENCVCNYSDKSGEFGFNDGDYIADGKPPKSSVNV